MRRRRVPAALAVSTALLALGLAACGSDTRRYQARGVVFEVNQEFRQLLIDHEEIPGLMPAMTMNFDVADPALLETLEPGQRIDFELEFTGSSYRVLSARVVGEGEAGEGRLAGLAKVRSPAPDFELTDQAGRSVSLAGLRGRTLLVDFVYTSCPGPCPVLTSQHVVLQRKLPAQLAERVWFVSISLDPLRDTPEARRAYAEARSADLSRWSFLTGEPERVAAIVRRYGVGTLRQPGGEIEHLVASFLVDAEGRIAQRYVGLDHEPEAILRDIERVAGG